MDTEEKQKKFFLIAIGASAGGLEAISEFLAHLPNSLENFAVIIAQHLSPNYKSRLVELLSRHTLFPVIEAKNGSPIEEKTIYITPPDCDIVVTESRCLQLNKPAHVSGPKPCVDILFNSVAEVFKERGIGIILSGTGNDGSLGIQKIKEKGGLTLCQELKSAKYDGMPLAAKETHKIDLITVPSKMGTILLKYIKNPNLYQLSSKNLALKKIIETLSSRTEVDFFHYKQSTIERRIKKRLNTLGIISYEKYLEYIEKNSEEIDYLLENVLIGATSFFRDEKVYNSLREIVTRQLSLRSRYESIRVWVPGCATGEEVYSLAILINEIAKQSNLEISLQIFGTDIDDASLMIARNGIYLFDSLKSISEDLRDKYFNDLGNGKYEVKKFLKSGILFSKHDITSNPPFLKLDIISCRNLLVYFESLAQEKILAVFHYALNSNGILILGKNENPKGLDEFFRPYDKRNKIFGKNTSVSSAIRKRIRPTRTYSGVFPSTETNLQAMPPVNLKTLALQTILDSNEYSFVILNKNWDILELYGKVNEYLEITPGIMNSNIKKFIKAEYNTSVLTAINHFNSKQAPFIGDWQKRKREENLEELFRIKVLPLSERETENLVLLLFESILLKNEEQFVSQNFETNEILERNKELEKELISTKEVLQTYIEELETTNEELQASNEELMSINEELQATNEELETTNEELQSTNEELQTAYTEMKVLNESLEASKEKLKKAEQNLHLLIDTNPQGFILLDSAYSIQEFNKIASRMSESILNKPLKKEESFFDYNFVDTLPHLKEILAKVMNGKIIELEKKIQNESNSFNWCKISYYPIIFNENVEAIAIFIMDVTDKKKSLELNENLMIQLNLELEKKTKELQEVNRFLQAELEKEKKLVQELELAKKALLSTRERYQVLTSNIPASDLFLFDKDFKVLLACGRELLKKDWNEVDYFGKDLKEILGDKTWELIEPFFEVFLSGEKVFSEITINFEIFDLQIVPIFDFENNIEYGVCIVQNVTETRLFEIQSRYNENVIQILLSIAPVGICLFDNALNCIMINKEASKLLEKSEEEMIGRDLKTVISNIPINYERIQTNIQNFQVEKNNSLWTSNDKGLFIETLWSSFTSIDQKRFYLLLLKDVSELKKYELELKRINEELEERVKKEVASSRAKDMLLITQSRFAAMGEMISNIAHQWRQPLSSLASIFQNLIDTYRFGELTEEQVSKFEKKIFPIIEHMSKTIDDFRNFFKPNREKQIFNVITECIDKAMNILENRMQKLGIQVVRDVRETIMIEGYPNEFLQVLINILNNSLDAFEARSIQEKRIIISCYSKDNKNIISILDNAGGVPQTIHDKIFDPYFTTKEKGTGIGLYMSKMIVEKSMGGKFSFIPHENGAEFRIELEIFLT